MIIFYVYCDCALCTIMCVINNISKYIYFQWPYITINACRIKCVIRLIMVSNREVTYI